MNTHQDSETRFWTFFESSLNLDPDGLTDTIFTAFATFEQWYQAQQSVKHYRVAELLEAIKQQGNQYFIAIRNSVETANDGVAFAQDAQALCEMLTSGKHKTHELKAFLDSMIDIAAKAHKRSVVTKELFTKVRRELFEISNKIPLYAEELRISQKNLGDNSSVGRSRRIASLPSRLRNDSLVDGRDKRRRVQMASSRRFEEKSFADVYSEFSQAKDDLDQLINIVNASAGWWNDIETQLKSLQLSLSTLDRPNPLRIKGIERRWSDIRLKFLTYSLRVALIQDLCPTVGQGSQIEAPPGRVTSQESSSNNVSSSRKQDRPAAAPSDPVSYHPSTDVRSSGGSQHSSATANRHAQSHMTPSPPKTKVPPLQRTSSEYSTNEGQSHGPSKRVVGESGGRHSNVPPSAFQHPVEPSSGTGMSRTYSNKGPIGRQSSSSSIQVTRPPPSGPSDRASTSHPHAPTAFRPTNPDGDPSNKLDRKKSAKSDTNTSISRQISSSSIQVNRPTPSGPIDRAMSTSHPHAPTAVRPTGSDSDPLNKLNRKNSASHPHAPTAFHPPSNSDGNPSIKLNRTNSTGSDAKISINRQNSSNLHAPTTFRLPPNSNSDLSNKSNTTNSPRSDAKISIHPSSSSHPHAPTAFHPPSNSDGNPPIKLNRTNSTRSDVKISISRQISTSTVGPPAEHTRANLTVPGASRAPSLNTPLQAHPPTANSYELTTRASKNTLGLPNDRPITPTSQGPSTYSETVQPSTSTCPTSLDPSNPPVQPSSRQPAKSPPKVSNSAKDKKEEKGGSCCIIC